MKQTFASVHPIASFKYYSQELLRSGSFLYAIIYNCRILMQRLKLLIKVANLNLQYFPSAHPKIEVLIDNRSVKHPVITPTSHFSTAREKRMAHSQRILWKYSQYGAKIINYEDKLLPS